MQDSNTVATLTIPQHDVSTAKQTTTINENTESAKLRIPVHRVSESHSQAELKDDTHIA